MKATALEVLSEPLSLLVTLVSLALAVLAPTFHYHQFGEATRMARDAGFSALLMGGLVFAVFGAVRTFRREIESGTEEMALAHAISRARFYQAKTLGVFVAYCVFFLIVLAVTLVVVAGAAMGGELAARTGDVARIWGPCVAAGTAVILLPLIVGAVLNRFGRFRFVLSTFVTWLLLALIAGVAVVIWRTPLLTPYFPAALPLMAVTLVFLSACSAFSVRFKAHVAVSCSACLFVAMLPFLGNFYLTEMLTQGGQVSWPQVGWTVLSVLPAILAFSLVQGWRGWTAKT